MNTKALIKQLEKISFYECQIKIQADINVNKILKLGAEQLGSIMQEDMYFIPKNKEISESKELIRIRKEGGENLLFVYKGPVAKKKKRTKLTVRKVLKTPLKEKELTNILRNYKKVISVNKKRTIFLYNNIIIELDEVENLGTYIEFVSQKEDEYYHILHLIRKLNLDSQKSTQLSYFELAMMNVSPIKRIFLKMHEKLGILTFGIFSAVLTTLGMIVGLNSATSSKLAVIAGIAAIAVADSLSDSLGMYNQKKVERGSSLKKQLLNMV